MQIEKWAGLITAASPYSIPPGANAEQNNIQVKKPGQLVPRDGMTALSIGSTGAVLALYRFSVGSLENDRLFAFRPASQGGGVTTLQIITGPSTALVGDSIFEAASTPTHSPTFCNDRHGTVYVFFGSGIRPQIYRHDISGDCEPLGLDAPTVAPVVTPSGDGFFVERVDVLSGGTSYFRPPAITVSGGNPDRPAVLRAVVQSGAVTAIDIVDGGSNYQGIPTLDVEYDRIVGRGFKAVGVIGTDPGLFGYSAAAAPTSSTTNAYVSPNTHARNLTGTPVEIAYKNTGGTTSFVTASFNESSGEYTAVIPFTSKTGNGIGAYATFTFNVISGSYFLGNVAPWTGTTTETTTDQATPTPNSIKFKYSRAWNTYTGSYYQNTETPAYNNNSPRYDRYLNQDRFWGLMPYPGRRKFAKYQLVNRKWRSGTLFESGAADNDYGSYYYPDYDHVGYRILTGPFDQPNVESNWSVRSSPVQVDNSVPGSPRPYIDIDLEPARKSDGTAYATVAGETAFPRVRVYLAYCPESWLVDNNPPVKGSGENWQLRYSPQSHVDRRTLKADTLPQTISGDYFPSGPLFNKDNSLVAGQGCDAVTRWWAAGHAASGSFPQARPVVDFRQAGGSDTVGVAAGTVVVLSRGTRMESDTRFAIRFEQYDAADYEAEGQSDSHKTSWLNSLNDYTQYKNYKNGVADMTRNGAFGTVYTDFYFQANALDTTATSGSSNLLPGSVKGTPYVSDMGTDWASGNTVTFTLQQRTTASPTFIDSNSYTFTATQLIAPSSTNKITSITIQGGGEFYYREPTILVRGGGGRGLRVAATVANGAITNVVILDPGEGYTSAPELYTSVEPAKLLPILRGTLRGIYRCAYRFADYRQTVVANTTITTTSGSTTATLGSAAGVLPDMRITGATGVRHMARIASVNGTTITLSHAATATGTVNCTIRDMTKPVSYSDFSPIVDVDASASGGGRASTLAWTIPTTSPTRADFVEFFRTSADQSLVFYRLEQYGTVSGGVIQLFGSDGLSDEELFDPDRANYAALPVVLPNGNPNAYRFGVPRSDMAVAVAWQDRLWYGVSTSGKDANTVFFSEFDEFESCPDIYEIPIQANLRASDYLTALVPFGSLLIAMQNLHSYAISFNTDPSVDASVQLVSHRGCLCQQCWDIFDDLLYAVDERGVYASDRAGSVEPLSEAIRDYFDEGKIDFSHRLKFFLKVDQKAGILRFFCSLKGFNSPNPHIAFCYHIANKAWWTETFPNSMLCATDLRLSDGQDVAIYGGLDGLLYRSSGRTDVLYRTITSVSVSNGGSGYVTPPTVTINSANGRGAVFKALIRNGSVSEVLVMDGGFGYGIVNNDGTFTATETLVFSAPPSGTTAAGTATASSASDTLYQSVSWRFRTGPLALAYEGNSRNGERQIDRSISVTYQPTATANATADKLILREYYNNSSAPRLNVMRRDRGTGFVHQTEGGETTLNMAASRSALGLSTGIAKALFAGRSLDDVSSADRHLAIELSVEPEVVAQNAALSSALIYGVEVRGVADGS